MTRLLKSGLMVAVLFGLSLVLVQGLQPRPPIRSGWQVIRPPHELSALVTDGTVIWAAGLGGVFQLNSVGEIQQELTCDRPLREVRALALEPNGTLWIGHPRGLSRMDARGCHTWTRQDGLPDDRITALYRDRQGRLWIGSWGGVTLWENGKFGRTWTQADGLAADMVTVILQDRSGGMWFGSAIAPRGGLTRCDQGRCQIFTTTTGLPHNNIVALLEDHQGQVWVGTGLMNRGGAARLQRTATGWTVVQVLTTQDGLPGAKVRSLFQDRDGIFWFGSENDGLARWDGQTWQTFTPRDGLAHLEVKAITQDRTGNLWLATRDGLTQIRADALLQLRRKNHAP